MNTTLLINYIDGLRQKRDLSQEPFIEGIISQRQYSRYKKGDNDVPFDVIIKLAERLSLSLSEVITAFEQSVTNESRDTKDFFNYVIRRDFKQAHKYEAQLSDKQFIKSHLKIYFFIARHILRYYEKKLTAEDLLVSLKKQIKYPLILDKETLSDMEIYALGLIMQHDKKEIAKIVDKLLTIDRLNQYIDITNPYIVLLNQFFIIKNLGRLKRFEELIQCANDTIAFCKQHFIHYNLDRFYYYKALAYHYLNQRIPFETAIKDAILEILRKPKSQQEAFFAMIEKDTKIKPIAFIKQHID